MKIAPEMAYRLFPGVLAYPTLNKIFILFISLCILPIDLSFNL